MYFRMLKRRRILDGERERGAVEDKQLHDAAMRTWPTL